VKLSKYVRAELIEPELTPGDKEETLQRLTRLALKGLKGECQSGPEQVLAALREREAVTSTGIGNGVAIPHAKIDGLARMSLVLGRSATGIDFQALDDAPVHLVFMVIAPPKAISDYLKLLAAISAFVKNERNRKALLAARTREEIIAAIKAAETTA
jgi:PTS system nitrogen regulatory IIA component